MGLAWGRDGWRAGRDRGAGWLGRGGASGRGEQAAQGWEGARQVGWEERGEDQGEGGEEEREGVEGGGHFNRGCEDHSDSVHSLKTGGKGAGEAADGIPFGRVTGFPGMAGAGKDVSASNAISACVAGSAGNAGRDGGEAAVRCWLGGGPVLGEDFGLFEDCLGGLFLLVGRVAVSAEDAADEAAEICADVFAERPVDGDVVADGVDEFAGDVAQGFVAEDLDGAVVGFERVVEGQFVFRERRDRD